MASFVIKGIVQELELGSVIFILSESKAILVIDQSNWGHWASLNTGVQVRVGRGID